MILALKRNASTNWLIGAALTVAVLVIASVAVALIADRGELELRPQTTPEGVVQRYLVAIDDDNPELAYSYLSPRLKDACSYQHFRDNTMWIREQDLRISLTGTESVGESQEVTVRIREIHVRGDVPFTPNESSYSQRFLLRQYDSVWRFYEPPWPMGYCPGLLPTRIPLAATPAIPLSQANP